MVVRFLRATDQKRLVSEGDERGQTHEHV